MPSEPSLPLTPTPLIGREQDVRDLWELLTQPEVRLVTLLGPAGVGKTRLAIQVARRLASDFDDGTYFVDLSAVEDPELVPWAVSAEIGLEESFLQSLLDQLRGYLAARQVLLVLDNFEQIIPAADAVADLLGACAGLKVIVTSRAPLQLRWERQFPVPSLALPDVTLQDGDLKDIPAVALFAERGRAVRPDFSLSHDNAAAVAEICQRLDGLPLAIELAAAQLDAQTPQSILQGLQRFGLSVLGGGSRDLPARQQTLREAIAWSERLLLDEERAVFHRLAVFSGGCTLEAAEAVCGSDNRQRLDVRAALTSLVRKNLVRFEPGTGEQLGRYRLLEMMREYGLERLREAEQEMDLRARHLDWCLALGAAAEPELRGRHQKDWMDLLEQEHDNLRAALTWCQRTSRTVEGLRLCAALGVFWLVRGFFAEGNRWCAGFLQASARAPSAARLWTLIQAAWLANSSRQDLVGAYADEALHLARALGDKSGESWALQLQARADGIYIGDFDRARMLAEEGLRTAQRAEDDACLRFSYFLLAQVARAQAKFDEAASFYSRAVALIRQAGDSNNLVFALANFGQLNFFRGDYEAAGVMYREALAAARDSSNRHGMSFCLSALPQLAQVLSCPERAAGLLGVTEALRERLGVRTSPSRPGGDWDLAAARAELGDERFDALLAEGRAMKLDDAIEYALSPDAPAIVGAPRVDDILTPREAEVAALVALGMSNRQIADKLVISTRTADRHVGNILAKLGLASRTQVATWALQHLPSSHTHTP